MVTKYRRVYALLKRKGHHDRSALEIIEMASEGGRAALDWIRLLRSTECAWYNPTAAPERRVAQ